MMMTIMSNLVAELRKLGRSFDSALKRMLHWIIRSG